MSHVAFGTPRKLPRANALAGRVAVLDIAFAAEGTGTSFEKVTGTFLKNLGGRLAVWVDHHDHPLHAQFKGDPRFVLATKAEHGACPEMIDPALVRRVGPVDTIVCHTDFDGLCSAAKWLREGREPYPGADADARAIDTRIGTPSERADMVDRALRVEGRDEGFLAEVVRWLADGAEDGDLARHIADVSRAWDAVERGTRELAAARYRVEGEVAWCDVGDTPPRSFDKTELLLLGQQRARVSMVLDTHNVTLAAPFDSGIDFLTLLGVQGGMPTRVSVPRQREPEVREALRAKGLLP